MTSDMQVQFDTLREEKLATDDEVELLPLVTNDELVRAMESLQRCHEAIPEHIRSADGPAVVAEILRFAEMLRMRGQMVAIAEFPLTTVHGGVSDADSPPNA